MSNFFFVFWILFFLLHTQATLFLNIISMVGNKYVVFKFSIRIKISHTNMLPRSKKSKTQPWRILVKGKNNVVQLTYFESSEIDFGMNWVREGCVLNLTKIYFIQSLMIAIRAILNRYTALKHPQIWPFFCTSFKPELLKYTNI